MPERFKLTDQAPPPPSSYGLARRYGVLDRVGGRYGLALLSDATLCFGMTQDRALDALIELRDGVQRTHDLHLGKQEP